MILKFFQRMPKPFRSGYLPEDKGHSVFFQQFGNPDGMPVLIFHGGPGSYSKPKHAGIFNLKKYNVILFDQRGSGKSLPTAEIKNNNTSLLLEDAKRLLDYLGVKRAVISGGSWGATLALLFAQRYTSYAIKIIACKTFLARKKDIDFIADESRKFYPDIFEIMEKDKPHDKDLRTYYADLILSGSTEDALKSASLYGNYEHMLGGLNPAFPDLPPSAEHMNAYKLYMHYDKDHYGLKENEILDNIHLIENIPTLIVHNRLDFVCPVEQSWLLHKALKNSRLVIIPDQGHSSPMLDKALKAEIEKFMANLPPIKTCTNISA